MKNGKDTNEIIKPIKKIVKIAFSGKMRSGKDWSVKYCISRLEKSFSRNFFIHENLADDLKDLCMKGFGNKNRETLQHFGTDIVRNGCNKYFGHSDFWINLYLNRIENIILKDCFDNLVIDFYNQHKYLGGIFCSGIRFPNEVDKLKEQGFKVVRLEVNREQQLSRPTDNKATINLDHESEVALDDYNNFDLVIPPCNLEELKIHLDKFIGDIVNEG